MDNIEYGWLAALAAALLIFMPAATAGIADYPLRLTIEAHGASKRLVAHNDGLSPITLHIDQRLAHADEKPGGETFVIEPESSTSLGDVSHLDGDTVHFSFYVGRVGAAPDAGRCYRLPYTSGRAFPISQAYGAPLTSHDNQQNRYAVDFVMPVGTPIVASRGGVVADATLRHRASGRDPALFLRANRVIIVHDDGTVAQYAHLAPEAPLVQRGQRVQAGTMLGHSGNTGYTSGPHLHFVVTRPAIVDGKVKPVSIPFCFYTGTPAVAFAPAVGMSPIAEYRQPALAVRPLIRTVTYKLPWSHH
jgi:murein DD-endopeptidase MepM/ murein hydrolase activator NlpD